MTSQHPPRRHGRSAPSRHRLQTRLRLITALPTSAGALAATVMGVQQANSSASTAAWSIPSTIAACILAGAVALRAGDKTAKAIERQQEVERQQTTVGAERLRQAFEDGLKEIEATVDQVRRGEQPQIRPPQGEVFAAGPWAQLLLQQHEFVRAVQLFVAHGSAEQEKAALLSLGRRMRGLLHHAIRIFDTLVHATDDPDVLEPLFALDHTVNRVDLFAQSLAIVGDAPPRRSSKPSEIVEVVRHAICSIEQYKRINLVPPDDTLIDGRITHGLIHLLAELLDNAANFSPPHKPVTVRVGRENSGLVIEIEDHGIAIHPADLDRFNHLLAHPEEHHLGERVRDGRLGLWVVALLATKHLGVRVRLQRNIFGSTTATVLVPQHHLHLSSPAPTPASTGQPPPPARTHDGDASPRGPHPAEDLTTTTLELPAHALVAPRAEQPSSPGQSVPALPIRKGPAHRPEMPERARSVRPAPGDAEAVPPPLPVRTGNHLDPRLRRRPEETGRPSTDQVPGLSVRPFDAMGDFARAVDRGKADGQACEPPTSTTHREPRHDHPHS